MKKLTVLLLAASLACCVWGKASWAEAGMNRKQYKKNLAYNKNAFPAGWQYEAGYTLWRMERKLPANRNTYRKYKRDKAWHNNMRRNHRVEDIALDTLDWTAEEIALFWENYKEWFKFHPAGVEEN